MSQLETLQTLFWRAARYDPAPPEVDEAFVTRGALSGRERLGIYRTAYWVRQVNALRELFPRTVEVLGDGPFARASSRYIRAHPSTFAAIEHLGRGFPAYLAEEDATLGLAAAVEFARFEVFVAPDAASVPVEAVKAEQFAQATLTVGDHVQVLSMSQAALETLQHRSASTYAPGQFLAVWRRGFDVFEQLVGPAEERAVAAARPGASVVAVCEVLASHGEADPAAIFAVLHAWFERGWVTSLAVL